MIFKGVELCCPHCKSELYEKNDCELLVCASCSRSFPVVLGIPDLRVFPDPYIDAGADRAKGLRVGQRFDQLNFSDLIDFYYSITTVVPKQDALRYKRGLLAGESRAQAALESWENTSNGNSQYATFLEIGCGTGPLLVAAAKRYRVVVGVDIAFRWLVVAKKRLAEAGLDFPLICACAEALPLPDSSFDRLAADSVVEHLSDQKVALSECHRVVKPNGQLFIATPNRYSLGPDPHVGMWGGSLLPESWLSAYVRRYGGIPPKRHLLSGRSLSAMIRQAGFESPTVMLPDIPDGQRKHFSGSTQILISLYHTAKRLPVSRQCLGLIGPLLHAVAEKPARA